MCATNHESCSIMPGPAAVQATETTFKGMDHFIQGSIGEGPAVEEQGICFSGISSALAAQARIVL